MPLSLPNHSAHALFAQRTRIPTSARSIGFCAIWVCISSSSSSSWHMKQKGRLSKVQEEHRLSRLAHILHKNLQRLDSEL